MYFDVYTNETELTASVLKKRKKKRKKKIERMVKWIYWMEIRMWIDRKILNERNGLIIYTI